MNKAATPFTLCGDGTGTAGEEVMDIGVNDNDDEDDEETIAEDIEEESVEFVEFRLFLDDDEDDD